MMPDAWDAPPPGEPPPREPGAPDPTAPVEPDYLHAASGIRSWLLTSDHKRIALMFLVATTLALMLGGTFAMLLRTKLLTPGPGFIEPVTYNRLFTLHGVVMVFMFMIPAIPAVFGNFVLPMMLGAKDLAFPRVNLASFYVYVFGAALTLWGMIHGGADTGWTFYAPYSTSSPTDVAPIAVGVFVLGVSSIMTGLNFIATTHMLRARGLRWMAMPIFVWSIYATSIIQVIATPVLGLAVSLVALDHALHMGIFDPAVGGDPVLFEHLFWFYSHPAVYIMILPAMGVIGEVVPTFAKKNQYSYKALAYSSLGIAFVGFLTWGHHLFVAGISQFDAAIFGVMSMFVAIFSAIKVFTWIGTLYRGSITFNTPMLYFFAFVYLFAFGGMTGIGVATTSLDVPWHDTYFVIAHFHFIMIGGTLTAFLAALHYWFPKMFGRMYPERWGLVSAALVFAGFNLTFVPQFLLGNAGMPRRYYAYPDRFHVLNVMSTLGAYLLGAALILTLVYLLVSLRWGKPAPDNPWASRSFEWRSPSPPPVHNFVVPFDPTQGTYAYDRPPPDEVPAVET
jgi:cytochrome c oxidase subunit 1